MMPQMAVRTLPGRNKALTTTLTFHYLRTMTMMMNLMRRMRVSTLQLLFMSYVAEHPFTIIIKLDCKVVCLTGQLFIGRCCIEKLKHCQVDACSVSSPAALPSAHHPKLERLHDRVHLTPPLDA